MNGDANQMTGRRKNAYGHPKKRTSWSKKKAIQSIANKCDDDQMDSENVDCIFMFVFSMCSARQWIFKFHILVASQIWQSVSFAARLSLFFWFGCVSVQQTQSTGGRVACLCVCLTHLLCFFLLQSILSCICWYIRTCAGNSKAVWMYKIANVCILYMHCTLTRSHSNVSPRIFTMLF